jgi:predicted secreted protein
MSWFTGILVYVILWWLVFFTTLPVGARSYHEAEESVETGNAESAPMRPRLWIKAAATTVIAALVWGIVYYLIASDIVTFRATT